LAVEKDMSPLYLGILIVATVAFLAARSSIRVAILRGMGVYPKPGKATKADVIRLIRLGRSVLAIRCYREIHPKVTYKEAKKRVDELAMKESKN
jgi:hypothetical protein